jgi:flagellar hook-associated protein 3 FlgL
MSERITPAMLVGTTLDNLNSALAGLQRSSNELSSGKKILEPSDNPFGASQVINLQSQLDGLSSYENNAQDGIAWETTTSSAMSNMSTVAERVRELLVQASSGTYNQGDLNTIASEVNQLTEAVKQDANTQYDGQYVFAGTKTSTPPYKQGSEDEYQGDSGKIARSVGPGVSITVNTDISSLLGEGKASGDGKLLDTLRTISEHLTGGTAEDKQALGSSDIEHLEANIETLSQLQATAGGITNQLHTALSRNEDLQTSITASLSSIDDTDIAATSIAYSNEQAAYEAALRAGASIIQESLLNFLQ